MYYGPVTVNLLHRALYTYYSRTSISCSVTVLQQNPYIALCVRVTPKAVKRDPSPCYTGHSYLAVLQCYSATVLATVLCFGAPLRVSYCANNDSYNPDGWTV